MAQTYNALPSSAQLVNSRQILADRDDALRSMFAGTSFPAEAVVGQLCNRTDQGKVYICTNATGPVFTEFMAWLLSSLTGVVSYANIQDVSAGSKLLGRITGAGDVEEIGLGTGFSYSGGNLAINVATALGYTPLNSASYTAADVLSKILTVDGPSSGLDADTLDGANLSLDGTFASNSDTLIPSQKAVKTYIDNSLTGLRWKPSVRVATTVAGTLATSFENGDTVDGVVLATGDRILIKNQSSGAENGIYVVAASGAPTRATDMDTSAEALQATCFVQEGTTNADTQWTCTTGSITLGSTALTFAQVSGAGTYTSDGSTITLTGNAFSVTAGGIGTTQLANNGVTYGKMQQMTGLSILGRSASSTGDMAAITGTDGQVLRVSGATLGFGTIVTAGIGNSQVTLAKIANIATSRILGRVSASSGVVEELTAANVKTILALAQADISGLTTASTPQFTGIEIGHATDCTLSRVLAGVAAIEGKPLARVNSGGSANTGLITWGTAAVGSLVEGEIYLKYT